MRSTRERALWSLLAALLLAAAVAAWWTSDRWWPQAGPWTEQAWQKITRPVPESLPPGSRPAATQARPAQAGASQPLAPQPRKCVRDGRATYTDQPCPKGSQELPVDGAVTSLPPAK
ncbi:DUF4124 domain-containing protein [Acidovorax sp. sic0104]|uniref:DUF4124 domain-containing protein n=1 Tax=Acidovorax sp. sic0104 TaxID=2854784 RepID=UPI001C4855FF|nr:DUF4124 domain-containing protein [Acidovorax sp. sic0104]MBV7541500.1 DUF4124 domain-containing protein [Acidovorax sp. sic0104]